MKTEKLDKKEIIKYAFLKSLPVMAGYIFLGIAFGIVLEEAGYNYLWALFMSVCVFAGSMQFAMVPLMAAGVSPVLMAVTTLFVNGRHIFYGISFVESFGKMKEKLYMIFALTDETYSVLCECKNEDPDEEYRSSWFFIALFDQCYWITGSVIGAILGQALPIDFTGIDFSMTALFVVILIEQIIAGGKKNAFIAFVSILVAIVMLILLGTSKFLLPALIIVVAIVSAVVLTDNQDVSNKKDKKKHTIGGKVND